MTKRKTSDPVRSERDKRSKGLRRQGGAIAERATFNREDADVDVPLLLHEQLVVAAEACSALGTVGDTSSWLTSRSTFRRCSALKTDVSMHFYSDAPAMEDRWRLLVGLAQDGHHGSVTLSPVVMLATAG